MNTEQKLDKILDELGEVRSWQAAHSTKHEAIARDLGELREDMPNVKSRVQTIEQKFTLITWWQSLMLGVTEKVLSGCIIGLILWMLIVYQNMN